MARSIFRPMRPVNSLVTLLLFAVAVNISLWGQAPTAELDFNAVQASEPSVRFTGGSATVGGIGGPGTPIGLPISVAIIKRDLAKCKEGLGLVDVQLSNIGKTFLTLPWSPDGAHTVAPLANAELEISYNDLGVTVTSEDGKTILAIAILFGNPLVSGSQLTLAPGQSAVLHNIKMHSRQGDLCVEYLTVAVTLSANRAVKSEGGYSLISQEKWRVQSQR